MKLFTTHLTTDRKARTEARINATFEDVYQGLREKGLEDGVHPEEVDFNIGQIRNHFTIGYLTGRMDYRNRDRKWFYVACGIQLGAAAWYIARDILPHVHWAW